VFGAFSHQNKFCVISTAPHVHFKLSTRPPGLQARGHHHHHHGGGGTDDVSGIALIGATDSDNKIDIKPERERLPVLAVDG
jgi:hypothetical protein